MNGPSQAYTGGEWKDLTNVIYGVSTHISLVHYETDESVLDYRGSVNLELL